MSRPVAIRTLVRIDVAQGTTTPDQDLVAVEAPLTLRVRTTDGVLHSLGVLMRTPGDDEALALGVLLAEGVITQRSDVLRVELTPGLASSVLGDVIVVEVAASVSVPEASGRGATATSACGLCGRLEVLTTDAAPHLLAGTTTPVVTADVLVALPDRLRVAQTAFAETGGLHAAGLCDLDGTLRISREDVGRHNAVDKVAGVLLQQDALPASRSMLVVSGRVAYEIVQKAARCGIPVVVAVGAPTDLAVDAARAAGITLAGFTRGGRCNLYTWPERVRSAAGNIPGDAGPEG